MAAFAAVTAMHAQEQTTASEGFNKGDIFITGSGGFFSQKQYDTKTTGFNIGPSAGYFVSEKIALGARLSYATVKNDKTDFNPENKQQSLTAGLFGRYYFTPQNKFSIFGQLGADYTHYKMEATGTTTSERNGWGVAAGPGFNYFITPHLALESFFGAISYGSSTTEVGSVSADANTFNINLSLSSINLGLTYKF